MRHQDHDIFENRKQFQLERMVLFSDAVFAIVITLLVIEIRIPEIPIGTRLNGSQLDEYLFHLLPRLIGFVISFFVVGFYWTNHHHLFGFVTNFDNGLIWLNLILLFTIALLPFTTSLNAAFGYLNKPFMFYQLNVGLIGLLGFFMWARISNPKRNLSFGLGDANLRNYKKTRSLAWALIFFAGAIFSIVESMTLQIIAKFMILLFFPISFILKKVFKIK